MQATPPTTRLIDWFSQQGWKPFSFQLQSWQALLDGKSGLLNAPTGSGKTYALALPALLSMPDKKGIKVIWVTPIRALANDLYLAISKAAHIIRPEATVAVRTGDTTTAQRQKQKRNQPDFLITTPESIHLMLAQKDATSVFSQLDAIIIDEWHELMGNKRGVLTELAISRLKGLNPKLKIWGISATIGNLMEAKQVLLGSRYADDGILIKANIDKKIEIISILPDEVEKFPWAGHLGVKLLNKVVPLLNQARSTLIFTNTRAQSEIWYQRLLEAAPELAGQIAMHHGSISNEIRSWVEEQLHQGSLKAVVCTSSLDLGVDFRPVDQIIQIGGPKGIARFLQRAGRSGHQPGSTSRIYFVPTHALELIEASAIRKAIAQQQMESKSPIIRAFDVLVQYLVTLAVGEGFRPNVIYEEIKQTHCFESITDDEWLWALNHIINGGQSFWAYDEFKKVEVAEDGLHKVNSRKIAMQHRMSIGAILSESTVAVKFLHGAHLGSVEEYFVSRLKPGDVFLFAGKPLEVVQFKEMTVLVKRANKNKGAVASWQGGRMPLSSKLSETLRTVIDSYIKSKEADVEITAIEEILEFQQHRSLLPQKNQLLIETLTSSDGHHLFIYPFEGRNVHEGLSSLLAYRIAKIKPITFSIAFNDYGFELLSDQPIPILDALEEDLFGEENLYNDIMHSINAAEMANRKFREIAHIAGLIFTGYPGKQMKTKHLQASSTMFFKVLAEQEPNNLLYKQAFEELFFDQLEEVRLRAALNRIHTQQIHVIELKQPSPFAFPIMVDRLREKFSTETLEDRIKKMQIKFA
jgi:ATP-dependent Lhr-like helicase